jgi:hypothetical protein
MTERTRVRRPLGVSILGGLVLFAAIVLILAGVGGILLSPVSLLPGSPIPGLTFFLWGLAFLFLGILLAIAGGGLLAMRIWAWWLAFLVALGTLLWSVYGLYLSLNAGEPLGYTSLISVTVIAVIFVYLASAYRAFRRPAALAPA